MFFFDFGGKKLDLYEISKEYLEKDINSFKISEIGMLQKIISKHNDLYYSLESPIISDFEYDLLRKKLDNLEKINSFTSNYNYSNDIGIFKLESTFEKVKHSRPMISLDNTYDEQDLRDFNERVLKNLGENNLNTKIIYNLEFKFDGLGVELIYKDGKLVQGITRGNGIEGEDITENVMQVANIPKEISYKKPLEVRGEVVMPISVFEKLNEEAKKEGTKVFSNPRNAASGSLRMKDASITKHRSLKFFAYDLANFEEFITSPLTPLLRGEGDRMQYHEIIKIIEKLGFEISSYFKKLSGIEEVISAIENFGNLKKTLDFEIDGLVIKVNDVSLWQEIGFTQHHPRYAIAYKFPAEILTTKILSVEHSVGRTGTITPVANLEPIHIGGVIVKRATLHNYEEVENLDVRIGDSVFIKRAGEVIPKIISVIKTGDRDNFEKILPPEFCPSCKTRVLKDEGKVRFYCPNNIDCPAKHSEKLVFAVGKQGFNIDGLGEKQVKLFLELGIIHNLVDIFKIENKREDILELEGFKDKSVNNLIDSVENAKKVEISTLLTALGIPGVGKKTAKTLSKLFESKNDLLHFGYSLELIEQLSDIGPEIANNVINYFNIESHRKILGELLNILEIKFYENKKSNSNSIFSGKKVCITGSFELEGKKISRDDLVKQLEEAGGDFVSSVSKNTDYLLAGEKAGSKLEKAKKEGVKIIDLEYFLMVK